MAAVVAEQRQGQRVVGVVARGWVGPAAARPPAEVRGGGAGGVVVGGDGAAVAD